MRNRVDVHNVVSGSAGLVVQAGTIHQVVLPPTPETPPIPQQLPPPARGFTGRAEHLAALDALLPEHGSGPGAVVISALDGTAGVGKTTLAVHWAHRVKDRFPDGTLFANLRGYGPSAPLSASTVLAGFLTALGVQEKSIPAELDRQCALYRSLLAHRRMLVLLDNAGSAEQVRPLLPGASASLVLVTSRENLAGLAVTESAHQLGLDLFTTAEARDLVAEIIGAQRAEEEAEAVEELIRVCAHLPLALRVAATRIAARRGTAVAEIVEEIIDEDDRLEALSSSGDERSEVRTVFDWSYTRLPAEHARLFRLLGLHPGAEFSVHAAAALAGSELRQARKLLRTLAEHHLIEPAGWRRYRCHDLLHAYAAHRAEHDEPASQRQRARAAMAAWYAHTADAADRLMHGDGTPLAVELGPVAVPVPVTDRDEAVQWLRTEASTLWEIQRMAAEHDLHEVVLALAAVSQFLIFGLRSLWPHRLQAETRGLAAARASRNHDAEGFLLIRRGGTHRQLGEFTKARADYGGALAVADEIHDPQRRFQALCGLGATERDQNHHAEAWSYYQAALPLAVDMGAAAAEAVVLCNLSRISSAQSEFAAALEYAERELDLRRQVGSATDIAFALGDNALARQGLGEHAVAIALCEQALEQVAGMAAVEVCRAMTLETMSASWAALSRVKEAVRCLSEAADILTQLGDLAAEDLQRRAAALAGLR